MPLVQSYAVWNNKGGVGKSTITFHVATRYAEVHSDHNVLVVDLCPQANSSMMLLGGGNHGEETVLTNCTAATPRTVVGYLSTVIAGGSGAALPNPMDFVVRVSDSNPQLTDNLYLLCGDGNLEPMAPAISSAALQPALTPNAAPWKWIHLIFRRLIENITDGNNDRPWMVFIDTNPSFSIYTELAMSAADRIICPVNADDSSRVATNAMFILLHGQTPPHPIYGSWTFAARAQQHQVAVPRIHLVVGNRLTQYSGAAAAFAALSDATADTLFEAYKSHPAYFTEREPVPNTITEFRNAFSQSLRDFNTAGVVSAHIGQRLSEMYGGTYPIHGTQITIRRDRVEECLSAVNDVVARL